MVAIFQTCSNVFLTKIYRFQLRFHWSLLARLCPINTIPALVQKMAWPMMVSLLRHICVTRPQLLLIFSDEWHHGEMHFEWIGLLILYLLQGNAFENIVWHVYSNLNTFSWNRLGGWKATQLNDFEFVFLWSLPFQEGTPSVLDAAVLRNFWIAWSEDGTLMAGSGKVPGRFENIRVHDPSRVIIERASITTTDRIQGEWKLPQTPGKTPEQNGRQFCRRPI